MAEPALKMNIARFGRHGLHEEIIASLAGLPVVMREVFVRSHYRNENTARIASDLGLPSATVQSLLADAEEIFYRKVHKFRL